MSNVATIGLDTAKSVFQVHCVDAAGEVVIRRKLTCGRVLAFFERLPRCLVGIEACITSHYWARELALLNGGYLKGDAKPDRRLAAPNLHSQCYSAASRFFPGLLSSSSFRKCPV